MKRLLIMTVLTIALMELGFLAFDYLQGSVSAHYAEMHSK